MSDTYVTLWTQERCRWLQRVGDRGPFSVLFGGPHKSLPPINHLKAGDHVIPIHVADGRLFVVARMVVHRMLTLPEYLREFLGMDKADMPVGPLNNQFLKTHASLGHRAPFGCVDDVAIGENGTVFQFAASVPSIALDALRVGPKPGRERPLSGVKDGILVHNFTFHGHVRRLSSESAAILLQTIGA